MLLLAAFSGSLVKRTHKQRDSEFLSKWDVKNDFSSMWAYTRPVQASYNKESSRGSPIRSMFMVEQLSEKLSLLKAQPRAISF